MTQNVHGAVNGLNDSLDSSVASTQPENTAVEILTGDSTEEVALDDPNLLAEFLPGGTSYDEFYSNVNHHEQVQHPITDSGLNTETLMQVRPAGEQLAEGQSQQAIFANAAVGESVQSQSPHSHLGSGGQQDINQNAEGSSDIIYSPEVLIDYRPGGLLVSQDFSAEEAPSAEHSSAQGPGPQLHGQEDFPAAVDGFNDEVPQAAVGGIQIASTQDPGSLTSYSSSNALLQAQTSALTQASSSAPSQSKKDHEETCWVKGEFYHRTNKEEHWCRFLQKFPQHSLR